MLAEEESHTGAEGQPEEQKNCEDAIQDDRFEEEEHRYGADGMQGSKVEEQTDADAPPEGGKGADPEQEQEQEQVFADTTFLTLQPEIPQTPPPVHALPPAAAPQSAHTASTAHLHSHPPALQRNPHPPASKPQPKSLASVSPRKPGLSKASQSPRKHVPSEAEKRVMARTSAYTKKGDGDRDRDRDGSKDQGSEAKEVTEHTKFIERVHDVGLKVLASFKHRIRPPQLSTLEVGGQDQTSPLLSFSWMDGLFDVMAAYAHKRGALEVHGWQLPHTVVIRNSRPVSLFFSSQNSDSNLVHFSYEPEDLTAALLSQVFADAAGTRAGGNSIVAQLLLQQDAYTQVDGKESGLQIEYMTCAQVEHYLSHTVLQDRRTALLQAFVAPAGDHNMTIRASFTAHMDVQIQVRIACLVSSFVHIQVHMFGVFLLGLSKTF